MKRLIIVVIVLVFCRPIAFARKWTDSNGKFSVEAEYVEFKDGKVHLKKQDGKIIMIPIEKFSESDQKFVKRQSSDLPSKRLINLINKLNGEDHSNAGWAAEQIGKLEGHAKAAVEPLVHCQPIKLGLLFQNASHNCRRFHISNPKIML